MRLPFCNHSLLQKYPWTTETPPKKIINMSPTIRQWGQDSIFSAPDLPGSDSKSCESAGMGGRFASESVAAIEENMHTAYFDLKGNEFFITVAIGTKL
jgi:hypothetical protein